MPAAAGGLALPGKSQVETWSLEDLFLLSFLSLRLDFSKDQFAPHFDFTSNKSAGRFHSKKMFNIIK
jgi:hypothetical protein